MKLQSSNKNVFILYHLHDKDELGTINYDNIRNNILKCNLLN